MRGFSGSKLGSVLLIQVFLSELSNGTIENIQVVPIINIGRPEKTTLDTQVYLPVFTRLRR